MEDDFEFQFESALMTHVGKTGGIAVGDEIRFGEYVAYVTDCDDEGFAYRVDWAA